MPSVLLTGANGFVAVTILQTLLDKGYNVVGTVRSKSKSNYLRDKFAKFVDEGKLAFVVVQDIAVLGAFDEVLRANKFDAVNILRWDGRRNSTDAKRDMLDPAIKGTAGILESVSMLAPSVKRVVITATFGNIMNIPKGDWPRKVYTEEDWNPITFDEQALSHPIMAYVAGKVGAERAAWDFVKEKKPHFTITTLCPPRVFGPPEQELKSLKNLNTSTTDIFDVFSGASEPRFTTWAWVDVRDLAQAPVLAVAIADYIWEHYPERAVAKSVKKGSPGKLYPDAGVFQVDNSKSIRDLGLTYKHDFGTMLRDTLKKLEELKAEGK
ncbi:methylglyoxal reductase (NADPH-dependent) gre2 [Tulasnella sp. UAMH 9824]|nr:methylglyoxal reductase (NADPH-dependent) gre2 [Tulasnella sp. UAMH 9824]